MRNRFYEHSRYVRKILDGAVVSFTSRKNLLLTTFLLVFVQNAAADQHLRMGGSGTDLATLTILCERFRQQRAGVQCYIPASLGSGGGVRAVRAQELDIGLTSRPLKAKEIGPDIRSFLYAKTPLVFATAKSNPIHAVTMEQLSKLYSGSQTHWAHGAVARPILRPASDSDTLIVQNHSALLKAAFAKARSRRGVPTATSDQDAAEMLSSVPGAFGTTTLTLLLAEHRPLKPLYINGVAPTVENTANGLYPLYKELYFVVAMPAPKLVREFFQFVLSNQGREILIRTGHVAVKFQYE